MALEILFLSLGVLGVTPSPSQQGRCIGYLHETLLHHEAARDASDVRMHDIHVRYLSPIYEALTEIEDELRVLDAREMFQKRAGNIDATGLAATKLTRLVLLDQKTSWQALEARIDRRIDDHFLLGMPLNESEMRDWIAQHAASLKGHPQLLH